MKILSLHFPSQILADDIDHLENSLRTLCPIEYLKQEGYPLISSADLSYSSTEIDNFLNLTYSTSYIERLRSYNFQYRLCKICTFQSVEPVCSICGGETIIGEFLDNDTRFTINTFEIVTESVKLMLEVLLSPCQYGYLLIRPPGHHSSFDQFSGFCLFNNVIMMANFIQKSSPSSGILILDWDVHHGNGTQQFISQSQRSNLYFVSLHVYDGQIYPKSGTIDENTDTILNVPMEQRTEDEEYIHRFDTIVVPYVDRILENIEVILISNGLDAHYDDPNRLMNLSSAPYLHMTRYLMKTEKKLYFILEGGYNPEVIARVSSDILSLLNNRNPNSV